MRYRMTGTKRQVPTTVAPRRYMYGYTTDTRRRLHGDGCKTTVTRRRLHGDGYMTTVTQRWLHDKNHTTTVAQRRLHDDGYTTTITRRRLHNDGYTTTVIGRRLNDIGQTTTAARLHGQSERAYWITSAVEKHVPGNNILRCWPIRIPSRVGRAGRTK